MDNSNIIVVADFGNHRIQVFDERGIFVRMIGSSGGEHGPLRNPYEVAIDAANNSVVSDGGNKRIQVFDQEGVFLRSFQSEGDAEGIFKLPYGMAVDMSGNIVVSDPIANRLQVFGTRTPHVQKSQNTVIVPSICVLLQ